MLVTQDNFEQVMSHIELQPHIALDTETTGIRLHHQDKLFSVVIADEFQVFYFNYKDYGDGSPFLARETLPRFNALTPRTIAMANAKFDLHAMNKDGVDLTNHQIWDVLTIAKCIENKHMQYNLAAVAKRAGYEKLSTVEDYIAKHKLFTIVQSPGKKTKTKNPHYDLVPLELIQEYAERDARITYDIFKKQLPLISGVELQAIQRGVPSFQKLLDVEMEVTKVCYEIEKEGMLIDEEHIKKAIAYEEERSNDVSKRFSDLVQSPLVDSNKSLSEAFAKLGIKGGFTKKGNPSFTDAILEEIDHPLSKIIQEYRDATKRANTYYKGFLSHADQGGIVHPNIRQVGADTFRFSITDPALQTLNKKDNSAYRVRDSFRARPGSVLVSIDYAQQEYRLTADYAGELDLIEKIKSGLDVHEATAMSMGLAWGTEEERKASRQIAKTINFALLYGAGVKKLALMLGVSLEEAQRLRDLYFSTLPNIRKLILRVTHKAQTTKCIYNWAGRKLDFKPFWMPNPDYTEETPWLPKSILANNSYKATNYLIQSSGAEIMRRALIELNKFLKPYLSRILLSIHDEILFEMPPEEFHLIPEIQRIMISVYTPFNGLEMDTSVAYGNSWGSLTEGTPDGIEARDAV